MALHGHLLNVFAVWSPELKNSYVQSVLRMSDRPIAYTPAEMSFPTNFGECHRCLQRPKYLLLPEIGKNGTDIVLETDGGIKWYKQEIMMDNKYGEDYIYQDYPTGVKDPQYWMMSEEVCGNELAMIQWHAYYVNIIL